MRRSIRCAVVIAVAAAAALPPAAASAAGSSALGTAVVTDTDDISAKYAVAPLPGTSGPG